MKIDDPELKELWGDDRKLIEDHSCASEVPLPPGLSNRLRAISQAQRPQMLSYRGPLLVGALATCAILFLVVRNPGPSRATLDAQGLDQIIDSFVIQDQELDVYIADDYTI